ncbi:Fe-S oxidoreductase [Candidatus Magnetomorum sp. HK-1]|nr:Fe-S oxidoreductase [Candidatus Magnetomorum sp. HK-1]
MNITLIYPLSLKQFIPIPPLGISVLSHILKQNGHNVVQIDAEMEFMNEHLDSVKLDTSFIDKDITKFENIWRDICNSDFDNTYLFFYKTINRCNFYKVDVVGFSIMGIYQLGSALFFSKKIKEINKNVKIVFGGLFIDENFVNTIKKFEEYVDFAIYGYGEHSLVRLIEQLSEKIPNYSNIPNLIYYSGNSWNVNNSKNSPANAYYSDFKSEDFDKYISLQSKIYKDRFDFMVLPYLISDKFCPNKCAYCRVITEDKKSAKVNSVENIIGNLKLLISSYNQRYFSFVCNEINPSKGYLKRLCLSIMDDLPRIYWFSYAIARGIDKNLSNLLYSSGALFLRFGIESGSQRVLNKMDKNIDINEAAHILELCHNAGIWNHVNLLTGFIHESDEDIKITKEFLIENHNVIDSIRINPFYLPPGSLLSKRPESFGIKINRFRNGFFEFDEIKGLNWKEKQAQIKTSTDEILKTAVELGIGFHATQPYLLFSFLAKYKNKNKVKDVLFEKHPYFYEPISPEQQKLRILFEYTNRKSKGDWQSISGLRNDNYATGVT